MGKNKMYRVDHGSEKYLQNNLVLVSGHREDKKPWHWVFKMGDHWVPSSRAGQDRVALWLYSTYIQHTGGLGKYIHTRRYGRLLLAPCGGLVAFGHLEGPSGPPDPIQHKM